MDASTRVRLRTGRTMPVIGLGTWELTGRTAATVLEAIELGYRMIDTSGDYGTQPGVGAAIGDSGLPREDIFLVTKVEEDEDAYEAVRRNLDDLGLKYADLILIHRPPPSGAGESLWEGLIRARDRGLTRDIGVSNYSVEQIQALIHATGETPVVNQVEWSPFGFSDALLGWCREHEIVIQAYSPLTRGRRLDDPMLRGIAEAYGKTPAQLILRWNIQLGTVPIPKASRTAHLAENLGVFDFEITDADMDQLARLNERYSALGELPYE